MGTELVGDRLSRGTNQLGTNCGGPNVGGPYALGTKCVTAFFGGICSTQLYLIMALWFLWASKNLHILVWTFTLA
jgi:hypothetical protein